MGRAADGGDVMLEPVAIPEGTRGPWTVKRFTISQDEAKMGALRSLFNGGRSVVAPGTYTQLLHARRGLIMSDTPDEMRDHYTAVGKAHGHVLITGLGIGMVLAAVLRKADVTKVTVIEIDPDVVALVGPHYSDPRVEIVTASAFDYRPPKGTRYGAAWHDIWDNICADNLPEMTRLKRRFGRFSDWQGCWCEWHCKRRR
jgi:hypothetical protein